MRINTATSMPEKRKRECDTYVEQNIFKEPIEAVRELNMQDGAEQNVSNSLSTRL